MAESQLPMIRFLCPTCTTKIQAPPDKAGLIGRCRSCGGTFIVPAVSTFGLRTPPPLPISPPAIQPAPAAFIEAPRRLAPSAPLGPITPFASSPKKKSYLLPIAIAGAVVLVATFVVAVLIDRNTDQGVAELPVPQRNSVQPTPPPRSAIPNYALTPSSNRPPPQRDQTPAFTPTPIPRPSVRVRQDNEPPTEIRQSGFRRAIPWKQIPTAPLLTAPVRVDNTIYFASRDGDLYALDATSLELADQKKLGKTITRLLLDGSQLKAEPLRGPAFTVLEFNKNVQPQDPEDIEANGKPTTTAPPSWYDRQHFFNQVVFYNGKYYQPAPRSIRILDDGAVSEFPSTVQGLSHWKIALLPSGPMGYDNSSVYELDEHLCPTKRIINLSYQSTGKATPNECFLAGDGKTLCFVQLSEARKRMTIWSLDGKHKLREYPVYLVLRGQDDVRPMLDWDYRPPSGRLQAVAGGYLFCGRELIFLPSGQGNVINFRPNEQPPSTIKDPNLVRTRYGFLNLTPPLIVGSKIIVGFGGGGIYVFDSSAFASGSTTSPSSNPR